VITKPNVIERAELKEKLVSEVVEVTFTKVNGDVRVMNCTLLETIVPKSTAEPKEDVTPRKVNEEIVVVWDVDAKGWRSFRINNITEINAHVS
jgi:hypothetical protein